jgi:hypothetical protein
MMRVNIIGLAGIVDRILVRHARCVHNAARKVALIGSGNW